MDRLRVEQKEDSRNQLRMITILKQNHLNAFMLSPSHIVDEQTPNSTAVVRLDYTPEPLLTRRVPYLQFDRRTPRRGVISAFVLPLVCGRQDEPPGCKFDADGMALGGELSVGKVVQQRALARRRGADDDHFKEVVCREDHAWSSMADDYRTRSVSNIPLLGV